MIATNIGTILRVRFFELKIAFLTLTSSGKGAAWLVILTPFILLFGPFLMSCYIFNLNKRFDMCWHKCWKTNPKYDWFNCKVSLYKVSRYRIQIQL